MVDPPPFFRSNAYIEGLCSLLEGMTLSQPSGITELYKVGKYQLKNILSTRHLTGQSIEVFRHGQRFEKV